MLLNEIQRELLAHCQKILFRKHLKEAFTSLNISFKNQSVKSEQKLKSAAQYQHQIQVISFEPSSFKQRQY
jgi:hypothetical protein